MAYGSEKSDNMDERSLSEDYETIDEDQDEAFIDEADIDQVVGEYDENDAPPSDDDDDAPNGEEWIDDDAAMEEKVLRQVPDHSTCSFNEHTDAIYAISVIPHPSSSSKFICSTSSGDDSAFLWTFDTQTISTTPIKRLAGHSDTVLQSQFNFDKSILATASMDGTVKLWNSQTGDFISSLEGPGESIEWIDWHPKGNIIIGGSADATIWMWNTQKETCLNVFSGHSDSVSCGSFTPDGKLIVSSSEDCSVKVWNPKTAECIVTYSAVEKNIKSFCEEPITSLKCHATNPVFLCGSLDGSVALCQVEQQRVLSHLKHKHAHTNSVEDVCFHPQQQHLLVSVGMDGHIVLWDTQSSSARQIMKNYPLNESTETGSSSSGSELSMNQSEEPIGITHVEFDSKQSHIIYTSDIQGNILSWDLRTGKALKLYQGHADVVSGITQCGDYIFSASEDKRALIFSKQ